MFLDSNGRQRKSSTTIWLTVWLRRNGEVRSASDFEKDKEMRKIYINSQKNFLEFIALLLMENILLNKDQWKDIKMNKEKQMYNIYKHYPLCTYWMFKCLFPLLHSSLYFHFPYFFPEIYSPNGTETDVITCRTIP